MENSKKKTLLKYIVIGILSVIYFYFATQLSCKLGYVSLSELNNSNIFKRLISDCIFSLVPMAVILLMFRKSLGELAINRNQAVLCMILLGVYLLCFILHGNFSADGWYKLFFYIIFVAGFEELWARGLLYLQLKPCGKAAAILVGGVFFGIMHAVVPSVLNGNGLGEMFSSMFSYLGFGLIGGLLFIFLLEMSGTIFVPILIHAIMDFAPDPLVYIGTLVGTVLWLIFVKIKKTCREN
ncbi:MAG: CPBP family intramembrane metalloprotease [Oscillospiraceae bacterium]|nr:CPBP family intramembrane metalloprotease [Oscillospiraceae bacterium]